jgi:hypothetical protein
LDFCVFFSDKFHLPGADMSASKILVPGSAGKVGRAFIGRLLSDPG